jgi:protein O-GlcNAc transferase
MAKSQETDKSKVRFEPEDEGGGSSSTAQHKNVGLGVASDNLTSWRDRTINEGLKRKNYSRLFCSIVRLLLRPSLLSRVSQPEAMYFLGVIAGRVGKTDLGAELAAKALAANPNLVASDIDVGVNLLTGGYFPQAESFFRDFTRREANNTDGWNGLGLALHRLGRLTESEKVFRRALKLAPSEAAANANISNVLLALGRGEEALKFSHKVLELFPEAPESHANFGNVMQYLGRTEDAEKSYRRAIELNPNLPEAYSNLGNLLFREKRSDEAFELYLKAIELRPDFAEAHSNLGNCHYEKNELAEAEACYRHSIKCNPNIAETYSNLGNVLFAQEELDEALRYHAKSVAMKPDYAVGYSNLGNTVLATHQFKRAIESFERALQLQPDLIEARIGLGSACYDSGLFEEASASYRQALKVRDDDGLRLREALAFPHIPANVEAIRTARKRFAEGMEKIKNLGIRFENPSHDGGVANFYIAYNGIDDRELQEKLSTFYLSISDTLPWVAPHCLAPKPWDGKRKLRIGFLSTFLRTGHTIGKLYKGIIAEIPRDRFEVTLIHVGEKPLPDQKPLDEAADYVLRTPKDTIEKTRKAVADLELDILYFTDIGMETITYFLAFSRLAPVQCVGWGHPDTTGIPNLDYFISSEQIEPENAAKHYSEKLAKLPHIPLAYSPPSLPENWKHGREHLNFPEDKRLYVCAQSLFKVHPDFDKALLDILSRDKNGVAIFIAPRNTHWDVLLKKRFTKSLKNVIDRIHFTQPLSLHDFLALNETADALLDTFHFSGGNSSLEAFAIGAPIVTLPGEFMRGRVTAGFYRQMGITDLIAESQEHYVELALKLANDKEFHAEMSRKIKEAYPAFIADRRGMAELAAFLTEAVARV